MANSHALGTDYSLFTEESNVPLVPSYSPPLPPRPLMEESAMADCLTLKKSNCKNCYKCIRHCPVKSIRFSGNQAYIVATVHPVRPVLCGLPAERQGNRG